MTIVARQSFFLLKMLVLGAAMFLRNLLFLPALILRAVRFAATSDGFSPDETMLRDQLLIPMGDEATYPSDMTRIAPALDLAAARDWPALLRLLTSWETRRAKTPTLSDMTTMAIDAIADQGVQLERSNEKHGGRTYLAAMETAYLERPTDHLMAALLAMQHIKLGWFWRGGGTVETIAPTHEDPFMDHFSRANLILTPFDAVTLDAPSVAAARYMLFACHPDAGDMIEDWFYDWVDLTPDAITACYEHGFQCLPQWFGVDEGGVDRAGLRAVAATQDRLGAAAYPVLWMAAYDGICDDGILGHMDVELFYHGLNDFVDRCSDPRRANSLTKALYDMVFVQNAFDATTTSQNADEAAIAHLRLGFAPFVRRNLTQLVAQMWNSPDEARWYAAQAYREELEAGAIIRVVDGAIQVDMPDLAAEPG